MNAVTTETKYYTGPTGRFAMCESNLRIAFLSGDNRSSLPLIFTCRFNDSNGYSI